MRVEVERSFERLKKVEGVEGVEEVEGLGV
jgi:hypothetical protein